MGKNIYAGTKTEKNLWEAFHGIKAQIATHEPYMSAIEAVLARGDRRCSDLLYRVWKESGGFDAWSEFLDYDCWIREIEKTGKCGIVGNEATGIETALPWDHVDVGVTKKFLKSEYEKAYNEELTPNCRAKCSGCGAACFKGGICVGK